MTTNTPEQTREDLSIFFLLSQKHQTELLIGSDNVGESC
jgi:hypothetical protein